ncbi:MAG: hypothetical protein P1V36_05585 [Planctomycetota bacterium]|nr:hypothetical protein [Planctomycetota bacterium]
MQRHVAGLIVLLLLTALALAPEHVLAKEGDEPAPAQPGDTITWVNDVAKAFEKAAEKKVPVMICINSRRVDGGREEPAAKGLREVVYRDPRIVTKSRRFVCIFLTSEGSSADYGELRARFGLSGTFVSPQHIFASPTHKQGDTFLARREYWPYGKGAEAVKQLLAMMDKALGAYGLDAGTPETTPPAEGDPDAGAGDGAGDPAAPGDEAARKAWIEKLLGIVRDGDEAKRRSALSSLVSNDKEGDCTTPVIALLAEFQEDKDHVPHLIDVVRALGIPELDDAARAMDSLLKHKDDVLRANVAVTLEYIGCGESVSSLKARVGREKDEKIANHMYRALGRCGVGDAKVRSLLLKKAKGAKSEWATYGPIVGLAYFEKDAKAARGLEKQLQAVGPPGGRRGGGRGTMKRTLLAWALSEVKDPKSGKFMREKLIKPMENTQAWWKDAVVTYYDAVARACEGDESAVGDVDTGIRRTLEFVGGTKEVMDDARRERDKSKFEPKADWEIEGGGFGGGGGRPGGGRGGRGR